MPARMTSPPFWILGTTHLTAFLSDAELVLEEASRVQHAPPLTFIGRPHPETREEQEARVRGLVAWASTLEGYAGIQAP